MMRTPFAVVGLGLLLAAAFALPLAAGEEPPPAPVPDAADPSPAPPTHPGLRFLGLNPHGAEEWLRTQDGAVMVRIPGGPYAQRPYEGDGTTRAPVSVEVPAFFIDKYEVANAQVAAWLGERAPAEVAAPTQARLPATALTGAEMAAFAEAMGARLPTKAQWEKAAGGPEGRVYPWGDADPDDTRANFARPRPRGLMPVGSFAAGASPYGVMDMAGNAYERVLTQRGDAEAAPVMIKGGSWLSPHPLNLRVLDMCMQPMTVAEGSVGFRLVIADADPTRPTWSAPAAPTLQVARDWQDAVADAQARRVPVFLSLQYDTCGQCDRIRAQLFRDPRFVRYCNEHLIVVVGHHPGDAGLHPHPPHADGTCPLYPGLECWEHVTLFRQGLRVVERFAVSPGNFVLHPDHLHPGAGDRRFLTPERALPKWGGDVEAYLAAFEAARRRLREAPAPPSDEGG